MRERNENQADQPAALVEALRHALSGSHGRVVSVESLRGLVTLEVLEWRASAPQNDGTVAGAEPLLATAWSLPKEPGVSLFQRT
jgi:hypothetical protein